MTRAAFSIANMLEPPEFSIETINLGVIPKRYQAAPYFSLCTFTARARARYKRSFTVSDSSVSSASDALPTWFRMWASTAFVRASNNLNLM